MSLLNSAESRTRPRQHRKGTQPVRLVVFVDAIWLPWVRHTQQSWRVSWGIACRHILPFFGNSPLTAISFQLVRQWQRQLRTLDLAPSTINRILSVFKTICNLAEAQGQLDRDFSPALALDWAKVQKPAMRLLELDDLRRLLLALKNSQRPEAPAVLLMLYTGAAKNVVLKARWRDIDLGQNLLRSQASRGPAEVLLPAEAVSLLASLPEGRDTDCLFPGRLPEQPRDDIFRFWDETRKGAGLAGLLLRDAQASYSHWRLRLGTERLAVPDEN